MPNEFVARNGIIALNSSIITGSLNVSSGITGSLFGTASWATNAVTSSYILNAVSASFASTASFVNPLRQDVLVTGSIQITGSKSTFINIAPNDTVAEFVAGGSTNIRFSSATVGSSAAVLLVPQNGTLSGQNYSYFTITGASSKLKLSTDNSANPIEMQGGNVLLNTTTDAGFRLDVNGTSRFQNNMLVTGSVTATSATINGAVTLYSVQKNQADQSNPLQFYVAYNHINPRIEFWGGQGARLHYNTSTRVLSPDTASGVDLGTSALNFGNVFSNTITTNTSSFFATVSGSVGIGKTTANSTLDVNGNTTITGSLNVTGSITTTGTITAQTLVVQTITSSVSFMTGSTRFGSLLANTHQFTGSVSMTGSLTTANDATINGLTVGKGLASVSQNTAFGVTALASNTSGNAVTAIGYQAGNANTDSSHNTYIGNQSGRIATGANNTFVGSGTGQANIGGAQNTFLGTFAGYDVTTGTYNTLVGYNVGRGLTTGNYNTIIGGDVTGLSTSLSNTIILADGQGNQRLYINSSGNVGIGTTSPNARLDVNGPTIITGSLTVTQGITGSLLGTASLATTASNALTASFVQNAISASFASTASFVTTAQTASFVQNAVSASFASTASSADNFLVRGTLTAQTIVAQTITSSTDFVTGSTRFGSLSSNTHQFTGSVSITGSLTTNGNTIVSGSLTVATSSNQGGVQLYSNSSVGGGIRFSHTNGGVIGRIELNAGGGTNGLDLYAYDYFNFKTLNTAINFITTTTANWYTYGGNKFNFVGYTGFGGEVIMKNNLDGTEVFHAYLADTYKVAFPTGSISIGKPAATTPNATLDVSGSVTITGSLTVFTGSAIEFQVTTTGTKIGNAITDTHQFTGSVSMTGSLNVIGGNVGIGTITPSSSLEINKNVSYTEIIGSANNPAIRIKNTNSTNFNEKAEVQFTIGNSVLPTAAISNLYTSFTAGTQQGGDLVFSTRIAGSTLDERMRILYNGNIGINTTSPSNLFEVNGISAVVNSFGAFTALQASGSTGYRWTLANDASFRLQYTTNGFAGLAGTPMYISSSGNVGIGTTTPSFGLDVSGTTRFNGNSQITGSLNISGSVTATNFTGSLFGTSSWAVSASWAPGGGGGAAFPYTGSALITGSLIVTGSTTFTSSYAVDINGSMRIQGGPLRIEGTNSSAGDNAQGLIAPLKFKSISSNYTLTNPDESKVILADSSGGNITITVPCSATHSYAKGTELTVINTGTNSVIITGSAISCGFSTPNVRSAGGLKTLSSQYAAASLLYETAQSWYLFGNLT